MYDGNTNSLNNSTSSSSSSKGGGGGAAVLLSEDERKLIDNLNNDNSHHHHQHHHQANNMYTASSPRRIVAKSPMVNRNINDSDESFTMEEPSSSSVEDPIEKELRRKMLSMLTNNSSASTLSSELSKRGGTSLTSSKKTSSPNNLSSSLSGTASLTSSIGGLKHPQQIPSTTSLYDDTSSSFSPLSTSSSSPNVDEYYVTCERERIKSYARDCKWELVSDNKILREYRMYAVEEWIFKSNHLWSAIEFTGNPRDEIIVSVFKPPSASSSSSHTFSSNSNSSSSSNQSGEGGIPRSLHTLFTKPPAGCYPRKSNLGVVIVVNSQMINSGSNLSSSGTGLGLNFIPLRSNQLGNDFDRYITTLKLNLQLKRLGCMRPKYLLSYLPIDNDAKLAFETLSGNSATTLPNVTSFVKELQAALSHLNYLPLLTKIDGQYDQKTINAVKAFQIDNNRKHGISSSKEVEGYIDQFTFKGIVDDINNLKRKLESLGYKPPNQPMKDYMTFNELMKNFQQKTRIYPDAPGKNILSYLEHIKDKTKGSVEQHEENSNNNNNVSDNNNNQDINTNNNNNNSSSGDNTTFVNRNQTQQLQNHHHHHHHHQDTGNDEDDIKYNSVDYYELTYNSDDDDEDDEYEYEDAESESSKSEKSYMDSHSSGYYESEGSGNDLLPSSPHHPRMNKYIQNITNSAGHGMGGSAPSSQVSSPSYQQQQQQHTAPSTASASPSSSSPLIQSIQNRNIRQLQQQQLQLNHSTSAQGSHIVNSQHQPPIPSASLHLSTDDEDYSDDVGGTANIEDLNKLETPAEAEEKQKLYDKIKHLEAMIEQQQKDYNSLKQEFEDTYTNYQQLRDRTAKAMALFSTNEKILETTSSKINSIFKELPVLEEKVHINVDTLQSYSNRIKRLDDIVLSVQRKNERNILISFVLSMISLIAVAFAYLIMFFHKLKRKMVPSDKPPSSNDDIKRFISKQKLKITELIDDLDDQSSRSSGNGASSSGNGASSSGINHKPKSD